MTDYDLPETHPRLVRQLGYYEKFLIKSTDNTDEIEELPLINWVDQYCNVKTVRKDGPLPVSVKF